MVGDHLLELVEPVTGVMRQPFCGERMEALSISEEHGLVGDVAQQRVLEDVLLGRRQRRLIAPVDELARAGLAQRVDGVDRRRAGSIELTAASQNTRPTTAARCSVSRGAAPRLSRRASSTPVNVDGTDDASSWSEIDAPRRLGMRRERRRRRRSTS